MKVKIFTTNFGKEKLEADVNAWLNSLGTKIIIHHSDTAIKNISVPSRAPKAKPKTKRVQYMALAVWYEEVSPHPRVPHKAHA